MTPTIQGLTPRQKIIADLLWTCETSSQMTALINSLPSEQDKVDATGLARIMIMEFQEEDLEDYLDDAEAVISRAMK
jgi:DNA replication protein DnaD